MSFDKVSLLHFICEIAICICAASMLTLITYVLIYMQMTWKLDSILSYLRRHKWMHIYFLCISMRVSISIEYKRVFECLSLLYVYTCFRAHHRAIWWTGARINICKKKDIFSKRNIHSTYMLFIYIRRVLYIRIVHFRCKYVLCIYAWKHHVGLMYGTHSIISNVSCLYLY